MRQVIVAPSGRLMRIDDNDPANILMEKGSGGTMFKGMKDNFYSIILFQNFLLKVSPLSRQKIGLTMVHC